MSGVHLPGARGRRRWPWVVAAILVVALGVAWTRQRDATRAPTIAWFAADAPAAGDATSGAWPYDGPGFRASLDDIRRSPGGERDEGTWIDLLDGLHGTQEDDDRRLAGVRRTPPPAGAVTRALGSLLGVVCSLQRRPAYVPAPLFRKGADGRSWAALVRADVQVGDGSPARRLAGRWRAAFVGEAERTLDLRDDGVVASGRLTGSWSASGDVLLLDLDLWDDPPMLLRGAAVVAADGASFEGASVEPRVRVFRGRRVGD